MAASVPRRGQPWVELDPMRFVLPVLACGLLFGGAAFSQSYPTHQKRPAKSPSPATASGRTVTIRHRASGTFTADNRTMKIVDGIAIFDVNENRLAKSRNPTVTLLMTSTPLASGELQKIAEVVKGREGAPKARDIVVSHKGDYVSFEIEFDSNLHPYSKRSARWVHLSYRIGSWSQNSSTSIMGEGLDQLEKDYSLLKVDPDNELVAIEIDRGAWKFSVDMTMFVRQKY